MADTLAPEDPYTTRFEATVRDVDGTAVVLSETYFYAESGGQPADRGTLGGHEVVDVQHRDGDVVHELAEPPAFEAGEEVTGQVDEAFRTYCMRAHTASHLLYGAGRLLFDDLGYGGFGITDEKVRVDFATPTDVDDGTLAELERLVNRAVWESRDVTWRTMSREEALQVDGIAFNTKTEEGVLSEADTVRVVEIDDWDVAACGGTHVRNTREVGPVSVLERSNPGEGLTRVEFAVGPPGIQHRVAEKRAALDAASEAGTSVEDLPDAVARLEDGVEDLQAELDDLRADLVGARIDELRDETVERDGGTWLVGTVDGPDANELGDHAAGLAGDAADVVALVGRDGRTFVAAAAADGFDASGIVEEVTGAFGGGGGGSPDSAQGGGIDADPETVVEFLRDGE
ncbi:MAG: DHHA1 domain-containing protein [Halobacteriales archaeon]